MVTTRSCKKRGFTLVELMIVIAIIAVLLTLLLPAFKSVRDSARQSQCAQSMRSLHGMAIIYTSEHDGYLPKGLMGRNSTTTKSGRRWLYHLNWMHESGAGNRTRTSDSHFEKTDGAAESLLVCPADPYMMLVGPTRDDGTGADDRRRFRVIDNNASGASYIGNGRIIEDNGSEIKLSSISKPSQRLMITEKNSRGTGAWERFATQQHEHRQFWLGRYGVNVYNSRGYANLDAIPRDVIRNEGYLGYNHDDEESINFVTLAGEVQNWDMERMLVSVYDHNDWRWSDVRDLAKPDARFWGPRRGD